MSKIRKLTAVLGLLAAAGVTGYCTRPFNNGAVPTDPLVEAATLGRDYAPRLAATYADGWEAAATTLERGGTVTDAQKALQTQWSAGRTRLFKAAVEPAFARTLPAGTEPPDGASRARVAALWRAFAAGLRGQK